MSNYRDQEVLEGYIRPFLISEGLPTDSEFIERLSDAFLEATVKLVHFRKDRALNKEYINYTGNKINYMEQIQ